jgi:hypothetical protein
MLKNKLLCRVIISFVRFHVPLDFFFDSVPLDSAWFVIILEMIELVIAICRKSCLFHQEHSRAVVVNMACPKSRVASSRTGAHHTVPFQHPSGFQAASTSVSRFSIETAHNFSISSLDGLQHVKSGFM